MTQTVEVDLGGRTLSLETGKVAKQAGGAVMVRLGDSVVLVTATSAEDPRDRKSTRLNSSHIQKSRMPSSA